MIFLIFAVIVWLAPLFWLVRVLAKSIVFYVYLWQLKEYHIGRFLDHFRTEQGKKLLWNKSFIAKIILSLAFTGSLVYIYFIHPEGGIFIERVFLSIGFLAGVFFFALYLLEVRKIEIDFRSKSLRLPVFTRKALFLTGINILMLAALIYTVSRGAGFLSLFTWNYDVSAYLFLFFLGLLFVDILSPIIVSAMVLAFQPFAVVARNRILQRARKKREDFPSLKVVGITGSYGKTSTKEFLAHILKQKYAVLKTPEHVNSEVGIANTILRNLTSEHDMFVCEMGAYNKRGIKRLAHIARPSIGVVTGVNEQHLATFGSMENLLSAEGGEELLGSLPKGGIAILNGASQKLKAQSEKLKSAAQNVKFIVAGEDIRAEGVRVEKESVSFVVERVAFKIPAYGGHNVQNLLLAIAAARELGMGLEEIARACETITPALGAMKVKRGVGGVTVIDSTYSANPDGVIADLDYLSFYEGKKILIMPCLIELGKASKEVHRRIGEKIGEVCDPAKSPTGGSGAGLAIITTKECFADVKEGAGQSDTVVYMENAQEIIEKTKGAEAILLEGGKETRLQVQLLSLLTKR